MKARQLAFAVLATFMGCMTVTPIYQFPDKEKMQHMCHAFVLFKPNKFKYEWASSQKTQITGIDFNGGVAEVYTKGYAVYPLKLGNVHLGFQHYVESFAAAANTSVTVDEVCNEGDVIFVFVKSKVTPQPYMLPSVLETEVVWKKVRDPMATELLDIKRLQQAIYIQDLANYVMERSTANFRVPRGN